MEGDFGRDLFVPIVQGQRHRLIGTAVQNTLRDAKDGVGAFELRSTC
jgi:hypothetical protein